MITQYIFWFLAFVAVFSGLGMILSRNPVYSVLSLVVTFFSIAGQFFLMNAQFLGAVHIIVYAGAIMVLFLYVIMMLNLNQIDEEKKSAGMKIAAVIASGILMLVMVAALKSTSDIRAVGGSADIGMTEVLGQVLYRKYLLPFEISSILFLGAMVGAVYLSKKEHPSQDFKAKN